jgi:sorbitol/mannitol transport system substrate-binding protein
LREVTTSDVAAKGRQFDVVTIGPYEAPQFGRTATSGTSPTGPPLTRAYDLDDIIPSVRNALSYEGARLDAAPFYGELSLPMYRKGRCEGRGHPACRGE